VLFLHGAGQRGSRLAKISAHGPPKRIAAGDAFPFVMVSPQCPAGSWWSSDGQMSMLSALLDDIVDRYRIDRDRIYLTGLSMGGFGTWSLAAAEPDRFAAIAPICGGGDPSTATQIAHLPIWVFHGAKDDVVSRSKSEEMVEALRESGNNVQFTLYPAAGHDAWTETYRGSELFDWFLSHSRSGRLLPSE